MVRLEWPRAEREEEERLQESVQTEKPEHHKLSLKRYSKKASKSTIYCRWNKVSALTVLSYAAVSVCMLHWRAPLTFISQNLTNLDPRQNLNDFSIFIHQTICIVETTREGIRGPVMVSKCIMQCQRG